MSYMVVSFEVFTGNFGHSLHAQPMYAYLFHKKPKKEERNIEYANKARYVQSHKLLNEVVLYLFSRQF